MLLILKDVLQSIINFKVDKDYRQIRLSIVLLGRKLENI